MRYMNLDIIQRILFEFNRAFMTPTNKVKQSHYMPAQALSVPGG